MCGDVKFDQHCWELVHANGHIPRSNLGKNQETRGDSTHVCAHIPKFTLPMTMPGEGKAIYANADTYEGQYWEGKKNGHVCCMLG